MLWLDRLYNGRAPKDLWPNLFNDSSPCLSLRQFFQNLDSLERFFHTNTFIDLLPVLLSIPNSLNDQDDVNTWTLEKNGIFSAKSFYKLLIDGVVRSLLYPQFF